MAVAVDLAGMLAHELRNPLASAATNIAVASELTEEADPRSPFLRRAEAEMDRIRDLLGSCLELACSGNARRRPVAIAGMLEAVARRSRERAAWLAVETSIDGDREFAIDPDLVARALENICENAQRALEGQTDARIFLRARVTSSDLRLTVDDSGPGVPSEGSGELFEPFVSHSGGSGLGLAFVRQVVRAHEGRVSARASDLGGACFEITIPSELAPDEVSRADG